MAVIRVGAEPVFVTDMTQGTLFQNQGPIPVTVGRGPGLVEGHSLNQWQSVSFGPGEAIWAVCPVAVPNVEMKLFFSEIVEGAL